MGSSERKNRQKAELRQKILDAARKIVVQDGFGALTIRKIAEAIEYAPGTIYLYFENRDAIAKQLCLQGYQELLDCLEPAAAVSDPRTRLSTVVQSYIDFGLNHSATYRLIFMEDPKFANALLQNTPIDDSGRLGAIAFDLLISVFDDFKAQDLLAKETNSLLLAQVVWTAVHGIVSLKLNYSGFLTTPAEDLGNAMIHTFLEGLVK